MADAGWHLDPVTGTQLRYWNGDRWTEHTSPLAAPSPAYSASTNLGPSNSLHYLLPVGRSWQSIWAPYLGLFSLVPFPLVSALVGAGAITLGILALRVAKSGGHGTGRAIVGIVLGSIGAVVSIAFAIGLGASS